MLLKLRGADLSPLTDAWHDVPGDYTNDWFKAHIAYWRELKSWTVEQRILYDKPLNFLEIGSYEGQSAAWLLRNLVDVKGGDSLTCVDPWGPGPEWEPIYKRFKSNVDFPAGPVNVHRLPSVKFWADNEWRYDFIYVDGSHKADDVARDIGEAWAALTNHGIILVDDFYNPGTPAEERTEVERGLIELHTVEQWPWPPAQFGIDALYQRVL